MALSGRKARVALRYDFPTRSTRPDPKVGASASGLTSNRSASVEVTAMNVSQSFYLFYFAAIAGSGYFFYLGRRLSLLRRIMAALHGLSAALIIPLLAVSGPPSPQSNHDPIFALVGLLAALSVGSIVYSMVALRHDWRIHLLHPATLVVLMVSLIMAAFFLQGT